jgi:hypothetical protein
MPQKLTFGQFLETHPFHFRPARGPGGGFLLRGDLLDLQIIFFLLLRVNLNKASALVAVVSSSTPSFGEGLLPGGFFHYARVIFDNPAIVFDPEPFVHPVNSPGILRLHNHGDKSEDAFRESFVVASICPGEYKRRCDHRSREEGASGRIWTRESPMIRENLSWTAFTPPKTRFQPKRVIPFDDSESCFFYDLGWLGSYNKKGGTANKLTI